MTVDEVKNLRCQAVFELVGLGHYKKWRVNGKVRTYKTRPGRVKLPIKHGLWEYSYITEDNCNRFCLVREG